MCSSLATTLFLFLKTSLKTSGHDGSIGRHSSPPYTTTSKLQLKYRKPSVRTSEIKLNGSLTTTELKKPHPSRLVGGAQTQNWLVLYPHVVDKNSGGIYREQGVPAPHQAPSQQSSARKVSPHNFWLKKPSGIESVEETSLAPSSSS